MTAQLYIDLETPDPDRSYRELPRMWDHQAGVVGDLCRSSYALFWEMRIGKTRPCCEALRVLWAERLVERVVILPPVGAKAMWQRWLEQTLPLERIFIAQGLKPDPISEEISIVICNPDILAPRKQGGYPGWAGEILRWAGSRHLVLIEDEPHLYFLDQHSRRYKAAGHLARLADRVWSLTGTPYEKSGLDIHHQLKHLGPRYGGYWESDQDFGRRWCVMTPNPYAGPLVNGMTKAGRIYQYRKGGFDYGLLRDPEGFLRAHSDVLDLRQREDCPELSDQPGLVRLDQWLVSSPQPPQPSLWQEQRRQLIPTKVGLTINYVRTLLSAGEGPVVVYGWSRAFTQEVARQLGAPLIIGGTPGPQRERIRSEFQAGQHLVVVINIRAGGVATEWSRSRHAVFGQLDWHAGGLRQAEARLQGPNQPHRVQAHYLLAKDSHEEHMWDTVLIKGQGMDRLEEAARRLRSLGPMLALAELEDKE